MVKSAKTARPAALATATSHNIAAVAAEVGQAELDVAPEAFPGRRIEVLGQAIFGVNSPLPPVYLSGFARPEEGFTWTDGMAARFAVKCVVQPGDAVVPLAGGFMLQLTARPYAAGVMRPWQTLRLGVAGQVIGDARITQQTTMAFYVPAALIGPAMGGQIEVTLDIPDAISPAELGDGQDRRQLGVAIQEALLMAVPVPQPCRPRRRPRLPALGGQEVALLIEQAETICVARLPEIVSVFESLGHNCEFGLVQRMAGAEPLGLLRFNGIHPRELLKVLDDGFGGFADPTAIDIIASKAERPEWIVMQTRNHAAAHSFRFVDETSIDELRPQVMQSFAYQRRLMLDLLRIGGKLFVVQSGTVMAAAEARAILALLRSYGPHSLLYVTIGPRARAGSVSVIEDGLYEGVISAFGQQTTEELSNIDFPCWISIAANACRLWREDGGGAGG